MINSVILPHVVLGYVLTVRDRVTLTELKRMKKKIQAINRDGLFVDLDESLIYQAEEEYPKRFRVELEGNEIVIYPRERFTLYFLNTCYRYLFHSSEEFNKVKQILLTPPKHSSNLTNGESK